jgi:hypothetical protein
MDFRWFWTHLLSTFYFYFFRSLFQGNENRFFIGA